MEEDKGGGQKGRTSEGKGRLEERARRPTRIREEEEATHSRRQPEKKEFDLLTQMSWRVLEILISCSGRKKVQPRMDICLLDGGKNRRAHPKRIGFLPFTSSIWQANELVASGHQGGGDTLKEGEGQGHGTLLHQIGRDWRTLSHGGSLK